MTNPESSKLEQALKTEFNGNLWFGDKDFGYWNATPKVIEIIKSRERAAQIAVLRWLYSPGADEKVIRKLHKEMLAELKEETK